MEYNLTDTEKKVIIPFIQANNLKFPVYMQITKKGISIQSFKTKLSLNIQEGFLVRFYLKGKFPDATNFVFLDENTVRINA